MIRPKAGLAALVAVAAMFLLGGASPAHADGATPHPKSVVTAGIIPPGTPWKTTASNTLTSCSPTCYVYADGAQVLSAADAAQGVGINASIHRTFLSRGTGSQGDFHTLFETAVQDTSGNVIEAGYNIDFAVNGDLDPHFFVFYWINGVEGSYNTGGGWANAAGCTICAGSNLSAYVGQTKTFAINHVGTDWVVSFNGAAVGSYPDSTVPLTSIRSVQFFGEIARNNLESCTDMGSGTQAGGGASATASGYTLTGSTATPTLTQNVVGGTGSDLTHWGYTQISSTSFRYGGAGYNSVQGSPGWVGSCSGSAEGTPAAGSAQLWREICPAGAALTGCNSTGSYVVNSMTIGACVALPVAQYDAVRAWNNAGQSGRTIKLSAQSNCNGATSLQLGNGGKGALTFEAHGIIRLA